MGCVYRALCSVTGKSYIGKTIKNIEQRKKEHQRRTNRGFQSHFYAAVRKYGWDSFSWSILFESDDECLLFEMEKCFISDYDSFKNGYNSTFGGEGSSGYVHLVESRKKMSESGKAKVFTDEHRKNLSGAHKGKVLTDETRQKMSDSHKNISDETKLKMSNAIPKKQVICVETGIHYVSGCEAARQLNVAQGNISKSCRTGCACKDLHFQFI